MKKKPKPKHECKTCRFYLKSFKVYTDLCSNPTFPPPKSTTLRFWFVNIARNSSAKCDGGNLWERKRKEKKCQKST